MADSSLWSPKCTPSHPDFILAYHGATRLIQRSLVGCSPWPRGSLECNPEIPAFPGEALAGHKRVIPLAVVLPPPARGAGTLIPSAQRLVWAAKQALGKAALGALFA